MYVIFNVIQFLNPDYNFFFEDLDNDAPRINGHYVSIKQDPVNLFCFFFLGAITHRYRLERSNSLGPMRVFFPMCYLRFIENKTKQVVGRVWLPHSVHVVTSLVLILFFMIRRLIRLFISRVVEKILRPHFRSINGYTTINTFVSCF